jgi:type IV secretory pathway TraG/TraD family ATPase VirD4
MGDTMMTVLAARLLYGPRRPRLSVQARVRLGLHPGPGWAGSWSVWRYHGLPASRKVARHARPSLPVAVLRPGRRGAWREYATFLGWAQGPARLRVYAHLESLVVTFAAPQDGKTQAAAGQVIDAPGPVVATSVRADLLAATAALRSLRGPVGLWDPEGVTGLASTFRWNLVAGCQDIATAVRRAGTMTEAVGGKGTDGEAFWDDQAAMVLGALLHAAALGGGDLRHVHAWAGGGDTPARILAGHPGASAAARDHLERFLAMADRTRQSIAATLTRVLKFMQLPACVQAVTTDDGSAGFDFEDFLCSTGTLYLVAGDSRVSPVPPLFAALVAELAHTARLAGRLDPPLTVILDEAGNIAPVPVAAWSSWAAGSGVLLRIYAQAWAQLADRWGEHGAALIWQCCKTKVIFGGTTEDTLAALTERACGTVRVRVPMDRPDGTGGYAAEEMPLLSTASLRMLPPGTAVVIQARAAPVIVRLEQVRKRADYKRRPQSAITGLVPATALPPAVSWPALPPATGEPPSLRPLAEPEGESSL